MLKLHGKQGFWNLLIVTLLFYRRTG
ncbi:hypothetical protein [Brevibacillus laterosporus]